MVLVVACGGSQDEADALITEPQMTLTAQDESTRVAQSDQSTARQHEIVDLGADSGGAPLRAVQVVSGEGFGCALVHTGRVKCWSLDAELGRSVSDIGVDARAVQLSAGLRHACALFEDRSIRCWGDNTRGQLGLGDILPRALAAPGHGDVLEATDLGAYRHGVQVSAAGSHTCALLDNGQFKCWGSNGHLPFPNS